METQEKQEVTIAPYMTKLPFTIGADQSLLKAEKLMDYLKVRHLPVLDAGKLVGILSDRDIKLVESFKDVDPDHIKVSEAYTEDPYIVSSDTPIIEVCAQMAQKKFGSVLVVDDHKLVGIFTWVDALQAMEELLKTKENLH